MVDLLDDDSDEPESATAMSYQRRINKLRNNDAVFKSPHMVLDLSDDEDFKNFNRRSSIPGSRRQSLLSSTIIDLETKTKSESENNLHSSLGKKSNSVSMPMPKVEPVNSLVDKWQDRPVYNDDIINNITKRYAEVRSKRIEDIQSEKQQ